MSLPRPLLHVGSSGQRFRVFEHDSAVRALEDCIICRMKRDGTRPRFQREEHLSLRPGHLFTDIPELSPAAHGFAYPRIAQGSVLVQILPSMNQLYGDVNVIDAFRRSEVAAKDEDLLHAVEIVVVSVDSPHASQEVSQLPLGCGAS